MSSGAQSVQAAIATVSSPGLVALLALLLSACGGATPQAVPPSAAGQAPTAAEPFVTSDGLVGVLIPTEGDWQCIEDEAQTETVTARWIQCRLASSEPLFFLMAKDYSVPPAEVLPPHELFVRHYERNYERMFTRFSYRRRGPVNHYGYYGYEVELDGYHPYDGDVRLRERAVVAGQHVLLLTAQGGLEDFGRLEPTVTRWFADARFAVLRPWAAGRTARRPDPIVDPSCQLGDQHLVGPVAGQRYAWRP